MELIWTTMFRCSVCNKDIAGHVYSENETDEPSPEHKKGALEWLEHYHKRDANITCCQCGKHIKPHEISAENIIWSDDNGWQRFLGIDRSLQAESTSEFMQLRDHPLMNYQGVPNWPPVWTLRKGSVKTLTGEVGVLKYVHLDDNKCYLVIDYQSMIYTGSIISQDQSFSKQIVRVLRTQISRSIEKIGDLDLSSIL